MATSRGAPALVAFLLATLLLADFHAHALTSQQGRQGDLSDPQAQQDAINDIVNTATVNIGSDEYYPPGPISATISDLSNGLRLHTRFILYNSGACFGQGVGEIVGYDLVQAFINNMLGVVRNQIAQGFGFGVVVEGANDPNLLEEGLSAQFYYWVERIGQTDQGAATPNTGDTSGPSDDNQHRHDELSIITGASPIERFNKSSSNISSSIICNNKTYSNVHPASSNERKQPLHRLSNKNPNSSTLIHGKSGVDCLPYENALFTSNNDINVLAYGQDGFPDLIYSPSERFFLIIQADCNLVLYYVPANGPRNPLWACGDACFNKGSNCFARLNLDGTFAVYDGNGNNLWFTPTQCSSGPGCWSDTYLAVQDDGNLVLYLLDTGVPIWATNTVV